MEVDYSARRSQFPLSWDWKSKIPNSCLGKDPASHSKHLQTEF